MVVIRIQLVHQRMFKHGKREGHILQHVVAAHDVTYSVKPCSQ
jgi:hypothetical protein